MQADILWGVLFLIVGLGIIFMPWEKKASAKVSMGGLLLDKEARKVTVDGRECLLRNLEFRLLLMFVEKENHILSRDEIKTSLWNETVGVDNRVNNLLSTLRKALKDFPEYQITLEGEDRYVLSMPAKVDSWF